MKRAHNAPEGADGFSLVELLIAMVVVVIVLVAIMSAVVNSARLVTTTGQLHTVNEEARQALNRISRDVRQATSVVAAVNPDGPGFNPDQVVGLRIRADFDGDGCIGGLPLPGISSPCLAYNAANPEDISYCFEPTTKQLYVIDNQATPTVTPISAASPSCAGGRPLLAGNVSGFTVAYRSNVYRDDHDGDGITTWGEIDAAGPPEGNQNGLLDVELTSVDSVVVRLTMTVNGHSQDYRTQIDLRNAS